MAYRMIYLRVNNCGYASGWQSDADKAAFKEESRKLFQELDWTLQIGESGVCGTVTKGQQELYLPPQLQRYTIALASCKSIYRRRRPFAAMPQTP